MSLTADFSSRSSISDVDLPIALRPAVGFAPVRGSIFDDPGDEKSWHLSQRGESLTRFYRGREPSWYGSAIAPLKGCRRVLDLGCGPGLALEALLEQGCTSVLGVDRWPLFAAGSTPAAPIVAHDLTLPMPFLESDSFDGVLSHYALDYVSPICARQVLREAHRLLAPGGRLLIYVAATGLGGGDETRTVAYSPHVLRTLLAEAGFCEVDVEASPNGRNSVAKARRGPPDPDAARSGQAEVGAAIEGDTQLSASFADAGDTVECQLTAPDASVVLTLDLAPRRSPEDSCISVCARAQPSASGGTEVQLWVWRGLAVASSERARFEFAAKEMRIGCAGGVEHASMWRPDELSLEPMGSAYVRLGDLPHGGGMSEAERGAEGRRILVESPEDRGADAGDRLGPGRNRFLIVRASGTDLAVVDREWLSGRAHGIALTVDELEGEVGREPLVWAGWRQALVFVLGPDWESIHSAVSRREAELCGPTVLVDPALGDGAPPRPPPPEVVALVEAGERAFVLLGEGARARSGRGDLERLARRLLHGGPPGKGELGMGEANETLRYLTERTLLMRLRQLYRYSPAEVGRRPESP